MVPSSNIPYNPAANGASTELLPEAVFGLIDVATLVNIHRYLRESEAPDDIELATWIQENYLNSVETDQSTAMIRTAQGFAQLDRAYRRVRSLTNKAQDKWPFFDQNFKQMSSATVRNNARGEAAPGVSYPVDSAKKASLLSGCSALSNGFDISVASPIPKLQVRFVSPKPSNDPLYKQEYACPGQQTPDPLPYTLSAEPMQLPESEKCPIHPEDQAKNYSKGSDMTTEADDRAMIGFEQLQPTTSVEAMHDAEIGVTADATQEIEMGLSGDIGSAQSRLSNENAKMDPIRDAGGGKVRGPNGRYLPKDDPKKAKKPKGKAGRPSPKTVGRGEMATPEAPLEKPENILTQAQPSSPSAPDQDIEEQNATMLEASGITPSLTAMNEAETHGNLLAGPIPAHRLAAEAEAVPSNLDRLPPNSRKAIKRKSEPIVQDTERKRGKYGGIVGRPRKSEQLERLKAGQEQNAMHEGLDNEVNSSPQMATRRSGRRSAMSNLDTSQSTEPTEELAEKDSKPPKKQTTVEDSLTNKKFTEAEDETMGDTKENAAAGHKDNSSPARRSRKKSARSLTDHQPASVTDRRENVTNSPNQLLRISLDKTRSAGLTNKNGSFHDHMEDRSTNSAGTNGVKQAHPVSHVEIFARLTTSNSVIELPIPADQINSDELKILEKYAEWVAQPDAAPTPYEQFRQIFSFAKKG